jgi:hypothetical protein
MSCRQPPLLLLVAGQGIRSPMLYRAAASRCPHMQRFTPFLLGFTQCGPSVSHLGICLFLQGKAYSLKASQVPEPTKSGYGTAVAQVRQPRA